MNERPDLLDDATFAAVIRSAPLICIDLIIRDPAGHVLLGLRRNEPARDFYFVPGGRIRKNERLEQAFGRLIEAETGLQIPFTTAQFCGVYEHLYASNRFDEPGYGTHCVVLGYVLNLPSRPDVSLDGQHDDHVWMSVAELKDSPRVHPNTKAYF